MGTYVKMLCSAGGFIQARFRQDLASLSEEDPGRLRLGQVGDAIEVSCASFERVSARVS